MFKVIGSSLLSVLMLLCCGGELAAQPFEATVIPTAFEPMWGMFHKKVIASRPLSGGSYYDVTSEVVFRSITAVSGDTEASADINAISLYDDVVMSADWETMSGGLAGITGSYFNVTAKLKVNGSGLVQESLKLIPVPAAGIVPTDDARLLTSGDSLTHYVNYMEIRVMESVTFRAKGGGCTSVEFLLYNSSTDSWDSVDEVPMDEELDMTGVAGIDLVVDRYENPEWIIDLGGDLFGPRLKVISHFSDETTSEFVKDLPIWQILNLPGGPGGSGGSGGSGTPGGPGM